MLAGLIQFSYGQNKIIKEDTTHQSKKLKLADWGLISIISLINIPLILLILEVNQVLNNFFFEILLAVIVIIFSISLYKKKTAFFGKRRFKKDYLYWRTVSICHIFLGRV